MQWPWVSRHLLDAALVTLQAAEKREAYWRARCERLTDSALVRAGAIHEPTFVERPPTDEAGQVPFAGMLMTEIPRES